MKESPHKHNSEQKLRLVSHIYKRIILISTKKINLISFTVRSGSNPKPIPYGKYSPAPMFSVIVLSWMQMKNHSSLTIILLQEICSESSSLSLVMV